MALPNPTTAGIDTFLSASLSDIGVVQRTTRVRLEGAPMVTSNFIPPGVIEPLTLLLTADGWMA